MKTFEVEFTDKKRFLTFNNRALLEIEDKLGEPLLVILSDEQKVSAMKTVNVICWAGLMTEHKLSYEEVVDLVPIQDFKKLTKILGDALAYSLGMDKKKQPMK